MSLTIAYIGNPRVAEIHVFDGFFFALKEDLVSDAIQAGCRNFSTLLRNKDGTAGGQGVQRYPPLVLVTNTVEHNNPPSN